jgi:hypothetical protein
VSSHPRLGVFLNGLGRSHDFFWRNPVTDLERVISQFSLEAKRSRTSQIFLETTLWPAVKRLSTLNAIGPYLE